MRVPSTPIILTAAALSLAGNVASSTTSANGNNTAAPSTNSSSTAPSSTMAASSSVATISSSSSISSSQVDKASTAETGSSSATPSASSVAASSSVSLSPATTSGKPARREVASPQVSNRIQSRFNRERYVIRSPSPKSDAVQAAADQSGDASPQPKSEMGGEYEAWEEAAGRKQKHQEHGKRDVMEAWEAASRHGSSNRWKRDGASLQARGLIKVRSKGLASSLDGRSTTAPLQEADKSKDKPKPKPVTKPKEVPTVAEEEALEDEDLDLTGEDGDDEADVASILEDRRRSLTASARRGSVNRLNLNGRRSKPSSRRGSFEEVGSEDDDSNSDSNSSPSAISSAHRRHNIKRLLDLQLGGGGKVNGHAHASTSPSVEDDDEDCEADDESVDQSSHISLSTRDEPDEEGDVTEEVEDKVPTKGSASTSFPKAVNVPADAASPLSPTLADLKWQDEQLQIAIKAIETLDGVGTTTGRKAKSGGYKKQKRDENIQSTMQDLSPVTDPATSMVSPFESSLPAQAQAPNPFASIPQESYTTEQQADINSLIKGLKGYGGAQSSWFMPGGQLPTVASAMSPLAGPIDSLPSGSGNRAQAQAQLQQALSVLGYANNPNALAGYLSQMGMVGQGQSPEQMAQGLLSQVSNLGNSQPFSSIQSQLGLGGLTSQQQNLLNSLGISKEAQSQLMSMGIGNLASQQSQLPISQLQQGFSSAGLDQQRQQLLNILQSQSLGNFEGMRSMGQMSSLGMSNGSPNPLSSMMNSLGTSGGSATSSQLNSLAGSAFTPTAQQLQGLSPSQLASLSYAATGPMRFMAGSSNGTASNSTMSSNATMSNDTMSMSLSSNTTMPSNSTVMPTNSSMPGPGGNGTGKRSFGQLPSSLSPEQLSQLQGLLQSQMGSVPNLGQYNPALGGVQQSLSPAQAQAVVSALSSLAGNANGIAGGDQLSLSQLKALQSQLQNGALAGTPAGGLISSLFGNLPLKLNALGQTTPNFPASGQLKVEDSKPTSSKSSEAAKETDSSSSTWSYSEWTTVMPSSMSSTDNRWPAPTKTSTSMTSNATPTSDTDADRVALGDGNKYAWSWSSSGTESSTSVASASPSPSEVALGTGNRYSWTWSADDAEKNSNLMSRWYNRKREDSKESDLISEEPQTVTVTKTVTPTSTPSMTKSKMHHSKTKTPSPTSSGSSKDKQGEDGADVEVEVMEDHSSSSKKHHKSSSLSSSASEPTSEGGAKKLVASASSNSTATSSTKSPCPSHSGDHGHPTLAAGQMSLPSGMVPYPDA